jgi:putative endonuclease
MHWRAAVERFRRWLPQSTLGRRGERVAARYLRRQGYKVVAHSQRSELGEVDLIAVDGRTIVFVEVKTRESHDAGHPAEAVDGRKQAQLTRLAMSYLKHHDLLACPARFDVVAVTWTEGKRPMVEHFRSAFEASGSAGMFS